MIVFNKEDRKRIESVAKRGTSPLLCAINCNECPMGHFDNTEMNCQEIAQQLLKIFNLTKKEKEN